MVVRRTPLARRRWARKDDGSPTRIFDSTTDTLGEMMDIVAEPSEVPHAALDTGSLSSIR